MDGWGCTRVCLNSFLHVSFFFFLFLFFLTDSFILYHKYQIITENTLSASYLEEGHC